MWAKHTYSGGKWTIAENYSTGSIPSGTAPQGKSDNQNRLELSTGMSEDFKAYNIYDLAGNMWEWTTETGTPPTENKTDSTVPNCQEEECLTDSAKNAVCRGGGFFNTGSDEPVVDANGNNTVDHCNIYFGFRVVLYLR